MKRREALNLGAVGALAPLAGLTASAANNYLVSLVRIGLAAADEKATAVLLDTRRHHLLVVLVAHGIVHGDLDDDVGGHVSVPPYPWPRLRGPADG